MSILLVASESDYIEADQVVSAELAYPYSMGIRFYPVSAVFSKVFGMGDKDATDILSEITLWADGTVDFNRQNGGAAAAATSGTLWVINSWNTVVVECNSATDVKIYVNAGAAGSNTTSIGIGAFDRTSIGRRANSVGGSHFDGYVAEPWIYFGGVMSATQRVDYRNGRSIEQILTGAQFYRRFRSDITTGVGALSLVNTGGVVNNPRAGVATFLPTIYYEPLSYSAVAPLVTKDAASRAAIDDLLWGAASGSRPKALAVIGDSTLKEFGGSGEIAMAWLRRVFHAHFGHTPGTPLLPGRMDANISPWLVKNLTANETAGAPYNIVADVPPGFANPTDGVYGIASVSLDVAGSANALQLNHRNDNEDTTNGTDADPAAETNVGFHEIESDAGGLGRSAYLGGTMFGDKSLIDCSAGFTLEVFALTNTGSATLTATNRPMTLLHPQDLTLASIESKTMFSGGLTLDAASGTLKKDNTAFSVALSGSQNFHQAHMSGTSGAGAVWLFAAWIYSDNKTGLALWDFAEGGYETRAIRVSHPNCFSKLLVLNPDGAMIGFGINDGNATNARTVAQFDSEMRWLIDELRTTFGSTYPIILLSETPYTSQATINGRIEIEQYAGVRRQIALDYSNIAAVNVRRVVEERNGWTVATAGTFTTDGVHYNGTGARAFAEAVVNTLMPAGPVSVVSIRVLRDKEQRKKRPVTITVPGPVRF